MVIIYSFFTTYNQFAINLASMGHFKLLSCGSKFFFFSWTTTQLAFNSFLPASLEDQTFSTWQRQICYSHLPPLHANASSDCTDEINIRSLRFPNETREQADIQLSKHWRFTAISRGVWCRAWCTDWTWWKRNKTQRLAAQTDTGSLHRLY